MFDAYAGTYPADEWLDIYTRDAAAGGVGFERQLKPPYRARGHREDTALWGVAARRIDARRLRQLKGKTVDLIVRNGQPDFFGLDPEGEYAVHAERLDGDFWEVRVGVL